ncbi:MAG: hypothetical protein ACTHMO_05235 [Rhodanobacteraceae bacterium]
MNFRQWPSVGAFGLVILAGMAGVPEHAWADNGLHNGPPEVSPAVKHDTLPSLRGVMPRPDDFAKSPHAHPLHLIPFISGSHGPGGGGGSGGDGAVQNSAFGSAPALSSTFDGVGQGFAGPQGVFTVNSAPPDTIGAVGATQYVQMVNTGFAVFDKSTKSVIYGPVPTSTLWAGFGGGCEANNDGDATVVWDRAAGRWIISQFSVSTTPYLQCVAVSATADATGAWYRYAFSYGNTQFPDYPKMGVWPDAYYETFNVFNNGQTFAGAKLCAYDRNSMLTGAAATQQCFQLSTSYGGVLPANVDSATLPPAGSPNYMLNFTSNQLNMWKFHVDWSNPSNTSLTGPIAIPVANFSAACGGGTCIPQVNTRQQLDSLGDRLMYRLAYRNFGDHESLVVAQSVQVGTSRKNPYTGVRWYELRNLSAAQPTVYQQSSYAPDTNYRWMPSVAMDKLGDIAVGFSESSSAMYPAIRYAGRLATDALSTLSAESSIMDGSGSQSGQNLSRWGDYSGMTVDPVDDCTFWYTNEYLKNTGAFNWSTRVGTFKFASCQ